MRNVTIRQLQMFAASADAASFARAAGSLRVSPAAVSFQIKQLEDMTGFALFERNGKKVALTDAGGTLLLYARLILQAVQDADRALAALRGVVGGRVTLGAVSTAKYIVPHMLARFETDCPGVAINLHFGNRRQILAALATGEVELAVMGRPDEGADLQVTQFAAHPTVVIAAPFNRLCHAPALRIADLAAEPIITREEGSGSRLLMENAFAADGIRPRIILTTDSNETIKQAVMAGMGIAVISRHTIGLELALGLMRVLNVEGFPVQRAWNVVQRRSMPLMPAHARLQNFLLRNGQQVIDALETVYAGAAEGKR